MARLREASVIAGARRLGLAALLLFAILVRAGIPAGWMPDAQSGGLVICTGHGELVLHGKSDPARPHSAERHDVCAFSGLGSAPAPETPALLPAPAFDRIAAEAAAPPPLLCSAQRHREQVARAPPRLI